MIRKIRNEFAHTAESVSFDTQSIADRCRSLRFSYHTEEASLRSHFTAAVHGVLSRIHVAYIQSSYLEGREADQPSEEAKGEHRKMLDQLMKTLNQASDEYEH